MSEKNNGSKKAPKPAARAAPASARAKPKAPRRKTTYYVTEPGLLVLVSDQKPKGAARVRSCARFAEAKSAAVDGLVQAIEDAERQLLALKRAANFDELSAARKAGWPA